MRPLGENQNRLLAAALIGAGVLLLVLRQFDWRISDQLWPLFVIVPGFALFAFALTLGRESKFLAVAGAVIGGSGLILLVQNLTDYYQSWAYLWTLLPAFAGLALVLVGQRHDDAATQSNGRGLILSGAVMFVVFATVFEGLIFHGALIGSGLGLPAILILLGVVLLMRNVIRKPPGTSAGTPSKDAGPGPTAAVRP